MLDSSLSAINNTQKKEPLGLMCGVSCEKLPGAFLRKGHKRKVHLSGGIRCPGKVGGRRSFSRAGDEKNSGFKVEGKKKKKVRPFPPPLALFVLHGAMFAWSWELQHMAFFLAS